MPAVPHGAGGPPPIAPRGNALASFPRRADISGMTALPPLAVRDDVLAFLAGRRSRPAKTLRGPGPSAEDLVPLLRIAARSPDHGKLEPWRFVVLGPQARAAWAAATERRGAARTEPEDKLAKAVAMFRDAPAMVAVVAAPVHSDKIPEAEQLLSAGAATYGLLTAALAAGWGANWLSGWMARDRPLLAEMGLADGEWIAGFVVIGTEGPVPPDRPRPDLDAKVEWRA